MNKDKTERNAKNKANGHEWLCAILKDQWIHYLSKPTESHKWTPAVNKLTRQNSTPTLLVKKAKFGREAKFSQSTS